MSENCGITDLVRNVTGVAWCGTVVMGGVLLGKASKNLYFYVER